jgi:hypothetical protein
VKGRAVTTTTQLARPPTVGRRVRVLAKSEALTESTWYTGNVVATKGGQFQLRMHGLPAAWFSANDTWFYAEPLFAKPKTLSRSPP